MNEEIRILSYFSLPTDLAREMETWPEFVRGDNYSVELLDAVTKSSVRTQIREIDGNECLVVTGEPRSRLFDKVVGRVTWALSKHSDNLQVDSRTVETEEHCQ